MNVTEEEREKIFDSPEERNSDTRMTEAVTLTTLSVDPAEELSLEADGTLEIATDKDEPTQYHDEDVNMEIIPSAGETTAKIISIKSQRSSHRRRILKAYKRIIKGIALRKNSPRKKNLRSRETAPLVSENINKVLTDKPKTPPISYPESFTKGMVTVRKIETLLEPKRAEILKTSTSTNQVQLRKSGTVITFYPAGTNSKPIKVSKVLYKSLVPVANKADQASSKPNQHSSVVNSTFVPKILKPPIRMIPTSFRNARPGTLKAIIPPPKILPASQDVKRVRLQKLADGSYGFVKGKSPPNSFQKAYLKSPAIKRATVKVRQISFDKEKTTHPDSPGANEDSTAKMLPTPSSSHSPHINPNLSDPGKCSSPPILLTTNNDISPNAMAQSSDTSKDEFVFEKPEVTELFLNESGHLTAHELPKESSPEPFKYLIPQQMLLSSTDKVKFIEESSAQIGSNTDSYQPGEDDLFVIEDEADEHKKEGEASTSAQNKSRRKDTLVPKVDNSQFEDFPFRMPPRPQVNIDLIETLSKYRVMLMNLVNKLKMPPIRFSEEDGDLINAYKIHRN